MRKLAALADRAKREPGTGTIEERDMWDAYRAHVMRFLKTGGKAMKIVVDASNGMAGTMVPKVFGKKGANVEGLDIVEMYFDNSKGEFVHPPNPLVPENLADLCARVKKEKAAFGICFDGDADRLMVVDEQGEIVGCDHLTAFLASWFLQKQGPSAIVYDLRSSKAVEEDVIKAGGKPVRSRVGHVFMKANLGERDAIFGGELSGHFYFRDNFNADSGAIALATVLTALSEQDAPVSELMAPIQRFVQSGEQNFEVEDKDGAIEDLEAHFDDRGEIDQLDGITIDCFDSEGWWCNVRKSNTEPLLRLNAEAKDQATLDKILSEVTPMLGKPAAAH
ncbi:MAG: hypothetical protein AAGD00_05050 [Planctomycetota bacterium]